MIADVETNMKLQLIRHLWGVTGNPETTFPKFRELGFTGIEGALPAPQERRKFSRLLKQHRETGKRGQGATA